METPSRQFRVGRCLGRGGFGEVYRAVQVSPSGLETEVALKVLREQVEIDSVAVRRLLDEGRMLARLNHPVVVRAYDLTRVAGRIGLVTEYVDGEDLDRCFRNPMPGGAAPPSGAPGTHRIGIRALVTAVGAVARALDSAWSSPRPDGRPMHVVHRDLKPSNVRIGRHGQVKLLDFGIARFSDSSPGAPGKGSDVVVGSVPYMAPERFERLSLPAGDVFGLGCCLFEGLTGQRVHPDGHLRTVGGLSLNAVVWDRHRAARLRDTGLTGPLAELVRECLAFVPEDRPTPSAVAEACEALAESTDGPSLRRFCAERTWAPSEPVKGTLDGETLTEGALGLPDPAPRGSGSPVHAGRARGTLDPDELDVANGAPILSLFAEEGRRAPEVPPAPAAIPSGVEPALPIGVTLLADELPILSVDTQDRRPRAAPTEPTTEVLRDPPRPGWRRPAAVLGCAVEATAIAAGLAGVPVLLWLGFG